MRLKALIAIFSLVVFIVGCQTTKPVAVDPCPMPGGYKLGPAVETAEMTLNTCPERLDQVFSALLDIAKHKPDKENRILIREMLVRLTKKNIVSEKYAKNLYNKYFDLKFTTLPDVKTYNLLGEIDDIKKTLRSELKMKKVGLVECCGDRQGYTLAEAEFSRVVNFMENLVYNEEYLKGGQRSW